MNTDGHVPVIQVEMMRKGLLAMLALLLVANPAFAQGFRSTIGAAEPSRSSKPFLVGPTGAMVPNPFPRPSAAARPLVTTPGGAVIPNPLFDPRASRPVVVFTPPPQVIVVEQYVYPTTAYLAPRQCETSGYWAYRQVPFTTAQNVWVDGAWSSDGRWTDSHWEMQPYSSSYNEPFWVPAQSYAC